MSCVKGLVLLVLLGISAVQPSDDGITQPNILFIMGDDHGWNDIGYRNKRIHTPNMDYLADSGVILDNYYVGPNCGPSRVQFLTGKYLTHLGLQHKNLMPCQPRGIPLREKTVADDLKKLGYTSHMIGKWHAGFHTPGHLPTNRGFQTFRGMLSGMSDHYSYTQISFLIPLHIYPGKMPNSYKSKRYMDFYNDTRPYSGSVGKHSTDVYKDRALELIDEHSLTGDPMFMWLSFQAPHTPYQVPSRYVARYKSIKNKNRRLYAAMITAMDEAIGEVVARLEDTGLMNNTILIYSSDNGGQALSGGASNYPLRGNKATYYEAGIRALSFVYSPLMNTSGVSQALFHITDWKPTILHLAGGQVTEKLDGVNQWQVLAEGADPVRQEVIYNIDPLSIAKRPVRKSKPPPKKKLSLPDHVKFPASMALRAIRRRPKKRVSRRRPREAEGFDTAQLAAIRYGDWKLITGDAGFNKIVPDPEHNIQSYSSIGKSRLPLTGLVQLYNVTADPTESNNLAKSSPDIVNKLLDKLSAHQKTSRLAYYPRTTTLCNPVLHGNVWAPYIN